MKKVLMIDYAFPPLTQRVTLKFAKYLRNYGWEPVILTVKHGYVTLAPDPTLLNQLPIGIEVYRTFALEMPKALLRWKMNSKRHKNAAKHTNNLKKRIIGKIFGQIKELGRLIFFLDIHIGWFPFAVVKGLTIIKSENINAIYSFASPYTSHLIACILKKITKLPWVCYFQDPWVRRNYLQKGRRLARLRWTLARRLEEKIINDTDKVICITQRTIDNFKEVHPKLKGNGAKFTVIPNNFDAEDFQNCKGRINNSVKEFQVMHVGTIYDYTNPRSFLHILRSFLNENYDFRKNSKFIFVGKIRDDSGFNPYEFEDLKDAVSFVPQVPFEESINYMKMADVLLLVIMPCRGAEDILTGRLVNYLGASKPILAVVPNGAANELIKESGVGFIVHPEDIVRVKKIISDLYTKWQNNSLFITPEKKIVKRFEVKELTKELAEILNFLVKEKL